LNLHIKTYEGIGDCLYTRPFIKILAKTNQIYIDTVLPKLFSDIPNVKFIKHEAATYRTQQKQLLNDDTKYVNLPKKIDKYYEPQYGGKELMSDSIISTFYRQLQIPFSEKLDWSLPDFSDKFNLLIPTDKKIAIIRPHTIRKEWEVSTRGANPNYIAWCCKILNEAGYFTIAIADLQKGEEVLADGVDVPAQLKLYKGELGIYGTLELIKRADLVVGGSGFIIPACASAQTPLFLILGGRLAYDGISKTLHPSMDLNKIHYANPANPCKCTLNKHDCDKRIYDLDVKFFDFLRAIQQNG
jgi:ADP-heptose:LPS heptosyltransferase